MSKVLEQCIGAVEALIEGENGVRFDVRNAHGDCFPAFAIRFKDRYFAYLNQCGHIATQLDHQPGNFFSDDGDTLVCSTHGAQYAPDTGACLGGPCYGIGLEVLKVREQKGKLYLNESNYEVI